MTPRKSIRWKVASALMGFGAVIIVGIALFAFQSGRSALVTATVSDLSSAVNEKEEALVVWRARRQETLVSISNSRRLREATAELAHLPFQSSAARASRDRLRQDLRQWIGPGSAFESLMILDPVRGSVMFGTDEAEIGQFKENRSYFLEGRTKSVVLGPFYSVTQGKAVVTASTPLRAANGSLLGVFVGRLNMGEVGTIMRRRVGVSRTFDSYLVNTARLFVSQPRDAADSAILARAIYLPFVNRCLRGERGWGETDDFRGVPVIAAYGWSEKLRLCVIAKLDQEEAFHAVHVFGWITMGGGVLMLVLAAILAFVLAKKLTLPILRLNAATLAVRGGDTDVHLDVSGNDEIAQLTACFNDMVSQLKAKDGEIAEYTATLELRVEERAKELREAQAELVRTERLATLGQLAATVSHELRNPLGTIGTSLAVVDAKVEGLQLGLENAIERMKRSISRCDRIITEMLDFARDRDLLIAPTDLDSWLAELLDEQTLPDGIQVHLRGNAGGAEVEIDPELLRRAVINLVENARDAMLEVPPESRKGQSSDVVVETRCVDGVAEISIIDTGPGMPAEVQESALEPLFSTKAFGVGLGLPVVKKIAEQHNGSVEIDSTQGKGTRITLKFPQKRSNAEALQTV